MNIEEFRRKYDSEQWASILSPPPKSEIGFIPDYSYIEKLLFTPVADGRHRIVWLILAPYATNILNLSDEDAVSLIATYLSHCKILKDTDADKQILYFVRRSRALNLKPPKLETIKNKDPELYDIIIDAIGDSLE